MDIEEHRSSIYDFFQASKKCQNFFYLPENEERYSGYYTSMYLIQDTAEGIAAHREKGFSDNPLLSYIEFWGVMQAIFIQQNAISELYQSITNCKLESKLLRNWQAIRELRNKCAGHPSKKDRPKNTPLTRTFMGRDFGDYDGLKYEQWQSPNDITHPVIDLGKHIDAYEDEASEVLNVILNRMREAW